MIILRTKEVNFLQAIKKSGLFKNNQRTKKKSQTRTSLNIGYCNHPKKCPAFFPFYRSTHLLALVIMAKGVELTIRTR